MRDRFPITLPEMVPGALPQDVIDSSIRSAVVDMVVTEVKMRAGYRTVHFFHSKDGQLCAIHDPQRETDYHK